MNIKEFFKAIREEAEAERKFAKKEAEYLPKYYAIFRVLVVATTLFLGFFLVVEYSLFRSFLLSVLIAIFITIEIFIAYLLDQRFRSRIPVGIEFQDS